MFDSLQYRRALQMLQDLPSFADTLSDTPRLLQAERTRLIGRCYYHMGEYSQALIFNEKALSIQREILGESLWHLS